MNLSNIQIPKIKISIRVIAFILALIGIVFFFWTNSKKIPEIETKTAALETSNKELKEIENNLATLYNSMDFYIEETERLHVETEDILTEFPTFMYLEDKILYADTLLKTDLKGYNLSSFTYGQSQYEMNTAYGIEGETKALELYSVGLGGRYTDLTYTQIKSLLDYGLTAPQRFVMKNLTIAYNEKTGYLTGEFAFSTYFIPGQSTPYEFPQHVIDGLGNSDRVDDLFGARTTPIGDDTPAED